MSVNLGGSGGRRVVGGSKLGCLAPILVIAVVGLGIWGIPKLLDEAGISGDDWSLDETLPEVTEDFGEDAKVVSLEVTDSSVTYEVIADDGRVHKREYFVESEETRGPQGQPATGRTRRTENSEHPASPAEAQAATVTLGELDSGVVDEMWEEVDFPDDASVAMLRGTEWSLSSGARPFDKYVANFDGSDVRQTQSKEDVFEDPAADAPPPQEQELDPEAQRSLGVAECVQRAQGDVAKIQACTAK